MPAKPVETRVRLDFDGPIPADFLERVEFLKSTLECESGPFLDIYTSPGGTGRHVVLTLLREFPPLAVVAMQAILGSDGRRETFNLLRALRLSEAPAFWHERWNVLYSEKFGRVDDMIDPKEFGRDPLKISDIGDADVAVVTIADVEQTEMNAGGEMRPKLILKTEEFPDKDYFVNVTGVRILVGKLGANEVRWIGQRVPLVRTTAQNPQNRNKPQPALHIADGDRWDDLIAQYDGKGRRGRPAKKATTRRR